MTSFENFVADFGFRIYWKLNYKQQLHGLQLNEQNPGAEGVYTRKQRGTTAHIFALNVKV